MTNSKSKNIIIVAGIVTFIIVAVLFILWGKSNTEEYHRKLDQYWVDYSKYCEKKGEKLIRHTKVKRGYKNSTTVTYEGSCRKN